MKKSYVLTAIHKAARAK